MKVYIVVEYEIDYYPDVQVFSSMNKILEYFKRMFPDKKKLRIKECSWASGYYQLFNHNSLVTMYRNFQILEKIVDSVV